MAFDPDRSPPLPPVPTADYSAPPPVGAPPPYRGGRQAQPDFIPFTVYTLIGLNILAFLITGASGGFVDTDGATLHRFGELYAPDVWNGAWWRLLASTFLHGGLLHIAVNMWALKNLGQELERLYGPLPLIVLYLGAGWAGALASLIFTGASVGASGAIFGLAGAWLAIALHRRAYFNAFGRQVLTVIVINLVIGWQARSLIDIHAHLGGLAGGFLLGLLLPNQLPEFRSQRWRWPASVAAVLLFLAFTPLAVRLSREHLGTRVEETV